MKLNTSVWHDVFSCSSSRFIINWSEATLHIFRFQTSYRLHYYIIKCGSILSSVWCSSFGRWLLKKWVVYGFFVKQQCSLILKKFKKLLTCSQNWLLYLHHVHHRSQILRTVNEHNLNYTPYALLSNFGNN